MWDDTLSLFKRIILPLSGLFFFLFWVLFAAELWTCSSFGKAAGMETKVLALECYIEHPVQGWIPYEIYERMVIAQAGLEKRD